MSTEAQVEVQTILATEILTVLGEYPDRTQAVARAAVYIYRKYIEPAYSELHELRSALHGDIDP